jgi:amino acid transporter
MSEKTVNPDLAAPRGIVSSIVVSLIAGWTLILAITSVIPTNMAVYTKYAPPQGIRPGPHLVERHRPTRRRVLSVIAFMAQAYCGMASVTANSRMLYAFSRDGAVPGHRPWHHISPRTSSPTNAIWFCVVFAFLLAVPSL